MTFISYYNKNSEQWIFIVKLLHQTLWIDSSASESSKKLHCPHTHCDVGVATINHNEHLAACQNVASTIGDLIMASNLFFENGGVFEGQGKKPWVWGYLQRERVIWHRAIVSQRSLPITEWDRNIYLLVNAEKIRQRDSTKMFGVIKGPSRIVNKRFRIDISLRVLMWLEIHCRTRYTDSN